MIWTHLNYGPSGSGKSVLPYTAAEAGWKVLHYDLGNEAGPLIYPAGSKLVRLLTRCQGDTLKICEEVEKQAAAIIDQVMKSTFPYNLVVLDSLDTLQACTRDVVIADEKRTGTGAKQVDDEVLSQRGYGRLYLKMTHILNMFLAAGVNFYATSTSNYKQDPSKPRLKDMRTQELLNVQIRPDLEGRLAGNIERFFDLVSFQAHDAEQGWQHRIFLKEQSSPKVKNRYNGALVKAGKQEMPASMDDPTWEKLVLPVLLNLGETVG